MSQKIILFLALFATASAFDAIDNSRRLRGGRGGRHKKVINSAHHHDDGTIAAISLVKLEDCDGTAFNCVNEDNELNLYTQRGECEESGGQCRPPCGGFSCSDGSGDDKETCLTKESEDELYWALNGSCGDETISHPRECKQAGEPWYCPEETAEYNADARRLRGGRGGRGGRRHRKKPVNCANLDDDGNLVNVTLTKKNGCEGTKFNCVSPDGELSMARPADCEDAGNQPKPPCGGGSCSDGSDDDKQTCLTKESEERLHWIPDGGCSDGTSEDPKECKEAEADWICPASTADFVAEERRLRGGGRRGGRKPKVINCAQYGDADDLVQVILSGKNGCDGVKFNCVAPDGTLSAGKPSDCADQFKPPCGGASCSDGSGDSKEDCLANGNTFIINGRCEDPAFTNPRECKKDGGSNWICPIETAQYNAEARRLRRRRGGCAVNCATFDDAGALIDVTLTKKNACEGEKFNCVASDGSLSFERPSSCAGQVKKPCGGGSCSDGSDSDKQTCKETEGNTWNINGSCSDDTFDNPKDCKQNEAEWVCPIDTADFINEARRLRSRRKKLANCANFDENDELVNVTLTKRNACQGTKFNCVDEDGALSFGRKSHCDGQLVKPCGGGSCSDGSDSDKRTCLENEDNAWNINGRCEDPTLDNPKDCIQAESQWICPLETADFQEEISGRRLRGGRRRGKKPVNCASFDEEGLLIEVTLAKKNACDGTPFNCVTSDGELSFGRKSACEEARGQLKKPCGGASCSDGSDSNKEDCEANGGTFSLNGSCTDGIFTNPKDCLQNEGDWICPEETADFVTAERRLRGGRGGRRGKKLVNCATFDAQDVLRGVHLSKKKECEGTKFNCVEADGTLSYGRKSDCEENEGQLVKPCGGGTCSDPDAPDASPRDCKEAGFDFTLNGSCSDGTSQSPKDCIMAEAQWNCPNDTADFDDADEDERRLQAIIITI
jgi:hypothetical protein